jgi:UDP-glucose 4-epimerase
VTSVRRAVVTGAGGFVGANLVRRLVADGHDVVAIERPGSHSYRLEGLTVDRRALDLRDEDAVQALMHEVRPGWVFHLAAHGGYSWQTDRRAILESNYLGSVNLVEAALACDCDSFVHAGSSSEYGYADRAPLESDAPEPNSHYAVTKAAATLYVSYAGRASGRRFLTLRIYSAFGPWEETRRLVPSLIEHGLRGTLPPLVHPDVARDFVYVDDVVEAFVSAATVGEFEPGGIFNIGTGRQTTVRELVDLARAELEIAEVPKWGSMANRAWDTQTWIADPTKAQTGLGWQPRFSLEKGFRLTVDWFRQRLER